MRILVLIAVTVVATTVGWPAAARILEVNASQLDTLSSQLDVTELIISGRVKEAPRFSAGYFPSMRRLVYTGDVDYVSGYSFHNCPALENVEFRGVVGHTDGWCFFDCPELRLVTFCGPVLSTGTEYLHNCPKVEYVYFNGLVINSGFGENVNCPSFVAYDCSRGAIINADMLPTVDADALMARKDEVLPHLKRIARWLDDPDARYDNWMSGVVLRSAPVAARCALTLGHRELGDSIDFLTEKIGRTYEPDRFIPKLELLRKAAPYSPGTCARIPFAYQEASDSLLTATRIRFNLDSVAGGGDDVSRIKNLLHFVHDLIRHDGTSSWPECRYNFGELYNVCRAENRGLNCRFLAMMLTEALLAEGIPARYISCVPRYNDTDHDSHVIAVAWSKSLGKWVWVDPTWDTWVTDENGLMLHPGEVRQRLIDGKPLFISDAANWNHEPEEITVEDYLQNYMAKNLYLIGCNTVNRAEPEGRLLTDPDAPRGHQIWLHPGSGDNDDHTTYDPDAFWAAPEHILSSESGGEALGGK